MATINRDMVKGRYRLRTRVRGLLPGRLSWMAPKGGGDCGLHEWYRAEPGLWLCYHCETGISREAPFSSSEQLEATARALRITADLPSTPETRATIARLVGELDRSVHPLAEELKSDPGSAVRIQAALQS